MSAKTSFLIAATLFSWLCGGCTMHFLWQFFRNVPNFIRLNYSGFSSKRILSYVYMGFVLFGFGYCIFRGVEAMLQFIPHNWRSYSDDGDDLMWVGTDVAFVIAFFGTFLLVHAMVEVAHRLHDCERSRLTKLLDQP